MKAIKFKIKLFWHKMIKYKMQQMNKTRVKALRINKINQSNRKN